MSPSTTFLRILICRFLDARNGFRTLVLGPSYRHLCAFSEWVSNATLHTSLRLLRMEERGLVVAAVFLSFVYARCACGFVESMTAVAACGCSGDSVDAGETFRGLGERDRKRRPSNWRIEQSAPAKELFKSKARPIMLRCTSKDVQKASAALPGVHRRCFCRLSGRS
ncbi:hypothetical protein CC80DRAFT_283764 [Byssothecium circinans]|uniref:Uncharacterized protein n=1 Tax=Byssothecium circinans TaxID=147558 RepID=A0A6A5U4G2_9PLEO|nr:hypothetical protein CC80DRAFT_283764 [Byssothecium circinans]